jgi:hypothetical protein
MMNKCFSNDDHVVAALVLLDQQAALGTLLGVGGPSRGGWVENEGRGVLAR